MKRLLCMLLLLLTLSACAQAAGLSSVAEIRTHTPARWTKTYETRWRTVSVDVAVQVPQAEAFPILKVRKMPAVDAALLPAEATVRHNAPGRLQYYTGDAEYVLSRNTKFRSIDQYPGPALPDAQAEDSSFTPKDALALAHERMEQLYGLSDTDFRLSETLVYSRIWKYRGAGSSPTFTAAVTDAGSYTIRLDQLLRGIPYFSCSDVYDDGWKGGWLTDARASVAHRGSDGCMVLATLWQVEAVAYADAPLLPFADALAAFEQEIMAGRLRTVDAVALGYAPYTDPDDPDAYWLLPVWYLNGGYATDPSQEFTPLQNDDGTMSGVGIEHRDLAFQAQLGQLMNRTAVGRNRRRVIPIEAWPSSGE